MREYQVRLTIRTNDREDEAERGEPYYSDQEMPREIRRWFDETLEDRDDHPEIIWSEFVLRDPERHYHTFPEGARLRTVCNRTPGCTVTLADEQERIRRDMGNIMDRMEPRHG